MPNARNTPGSLTEEQQQVNNITYDSFDNSMYQDTNNRFYDQKINSDLAQYSNNSNSIENINLQKNINKLKIVRVNRKEKIRTMVNDSYNQNTNKNITSYYPTSFRTNSNQEDEEDGDSDKEYKVVKQPPKVPNKKKLIHHKNLRTEFNFLTSQNKSMNSKMEQIYKNKNLKNVLKA